MLWAWEVRKKKTQTMKRRSLPSGYSLPIGRVRHGHKKRHFCPVAWVLSSRGTWSMKACSRGTKLTWSSGNIPGRKQPSVLMRVEMCGSLNQFPQQRQQVRVSGRGTSACKGPRAKGQASSLWPRPGCCSREAGGSLEVGPGAHPGDARCVRAPGPGCSLESARDLWKPLVLISLTWVLTSLVWA